MTRVSELAQVDDEELENRLAEYRRELLNLRFQLATSQLDNYSRMASARRDIARVLTLMRERESALAEGRDAGPLPMTVRPVRRRPRRVEEVEAEEYEAEATADAEIAEPDDDALEIGDLEGEGTDEVEDEVEGTDEVEDEVEDIDDDAEDPEDSAESEEEDG